MSIEASDIYIELKETDAWRPGTTKRSIAKEVTAALERSPEMGGGDLQPIQMRTNELVAGIRSDVAALDLRADLDELATLRRRLRRRCAGCRAPGTCGSSRWRA